MRPSARSFQGSTVLCAGSTFASDLDALQVLPDTYSGVSPGSATNLKVSERTRPATTSATGSACRNTHKQRFERVRRCLESARWWDTGRKWPPGGDPCRRDRPVRGHVLHRQRPSQRDRRLHADPGVPTAASSPRSRSSPTCSPRTTPRRYPLSPTSAGVVTSVRIKHGGSSATPGTAGLRILGTDFSDYDRRRSLHRHHAGRGRPTSHGRRACRPGSSSSSPRRAAPG